VTLGQHLSNPIRVVAQEFAGEHFSSGEDYSNPGMLRVLRLHGFVPVPVPDPVNFRLVFVAQSESGNHSLFRIDEAL
jgi:hypothetical protein